MRPIAWKDEKVTVLDQTKLPAEEVWIDCETPEEMARAIQTMVVRGAPAIGIAAAYGMALAACRWQGGGSESMLERLMQVRELLAATRPTAVNLFWALERMWNVAVATKQEGEDLIKQRLIEEALNIHKEDIELCRRIGRNGVELIPEQAKVLTHCNAGALATGDWGTALGVIREAYARGKLELVWVDETRPRLQGARLTAWELSREGIPFKLICDDMAGFLMYKGKIDVVITGADRITIQGDVANKIGTYSLAVLCRHHNIPFYVAAPYSTIDFGLKSGEDIPIEERDSGEIVFIEHSRIAPNGVQVFNPAFDVTPASLVSALITDRGVIYPPLDEGIRSLFKESVGWRPDQVAAQG